MSDAVRNMLRPAVLATRYVRHRLNPKFSYADDQEDVVAIMLLGKIRTYIDIGANDGISCSNTALHALRGAQGLCFEPNPDAFNRLLLFYRWASRIECVPEGLSKAQGSLEMRCDGLLSALIETEDPELHGLLGAFRTQNAPIVRVMVNRLATWLERRPVFQGCDLLSIDVEGHELNVLLGIDWDRKKKPAKCVIIETHACGLNGQWRHRDFYAIDALLAESSYTKLAESRNNTIWLHRDERVEDRIAKARTGFPNYMWYD